MNVIWFKRDLRVRDHVALTRAAERGPCLCLYVYEPEHVHSDEFDTTHLDFINECLADLDRALRSRGSRLTYRVGRMPDILEELHHHLPITAIWSHEETGLGWSHDRDLRVRRWLKQRSIPWYEFPQNGVIRGLETRDGWSRRWKHAMEQSSAEPPERLQPIADIDPSVPACPRSLGLPPQTLVERQRGGESAANDTLQAFLAQRGRNYRDEMSSPVTAWQSCSRLSPYLAWGCISIRDVFQQLQRRQAVLREERDRGEEIGSWLGSLSAFQSRLSWHCHFIQKLEDQPSLEFANLSQAYDGLREDEFNSQFFEAWKAGRTGYPLVDACMRALHQHRWINFRMRAMLVSFASYHLWLHWRPTALFLGRHFLDFEPGIHYSQVQMQAGTTGINAVRIYSPVKQVVDQDPQGEFIRKYVPELLDVPTEHLAEPHKMPLSIQERVGCRIDVDYPAPIVEHRAAYKRARERMTRVRSSESAKTEAQRIYQKHGSRRRPGGSGRS